jgi:hypothetical protein
LIAVDLNSQTIPNREKILKQEPKIKTFKNLPEGDYFTTTLLFETKAKRMEYMRMNMADYCLTGPVYYSGFKNIYYDAEIADIDTNVASRGLMITIKMSDNDLFVFMLHYLCNLRSGEPTGLVNVTYFNFKYGAIDQASAKSFNIKRKRLFPKNNIYTEELTCGKIKFITEDNAENIKIVISGKEIPLLPQLY